jgi:hypothetical protein
MAEGTVGPLDLPWWDAKKHQALAEIATAMQAPETIGPNVWGAVKDWARLVVGPPLEDTGDPVQNAQNLMQGFVGIGSIHKFPGSGPRIPTYGVTELPPAPGLMSRFLSPAQQALYAKLVAAGHTPEKALAFAKLQP